MVTDERGGTIFDGLALYLKDPEILKDHFIDLPGSEYGSGSAPCFDYWDGEPEFGCGWTDGAFPGYGSLVAGRQIVTR